MSLAPIALFVHARPAHTRRVIASLQANPPARDSELIVFSDAPKKSEQADAVREVREFVRGIDGFASVKVIERERNLGLSGSITDGISRLCREQGRVIALEDDLVVAPGFLAFLNAGLDRYADAARVAQISGYMFPTETDTGVASFLPIISCWGWATWKRAWDHYDADMTGLQRLAADKEMRKRFDLGGAYPYYAMACEQKCGKLDSWGIRWHLSVFMRDLLVLYPPRSLVQNEGVDSSGTHGAGHKQLQVPLAKCDYANGKIALPDRVEVTDATLDEVKHLLRTMQPGFLRRLISWRPA
ncbi:MAG TPA: glycosyltransferase [Pseudolabrys sp.]|nr:glycosyltransferase [Pseudolabrys sp.]